MGRSLDLPGHPPASSSQTSPSTRHPDLHSSAPTTTTTCTRFLGLLYGSLVVLGAASSAGAVSGGGGAAAPRTASAALLLTAFASNIDLSWQLTCYTCMNVTDNQVCNRFAIDRPCPEDKQFCHSLHVLEGFGSKGDSLLVNKGCAGDDECNPKSIGCRREGGQTSCNACCDFEYCNEKAPVDAETATFVQTKSSAVGLPFISRFATLLPALCLLVSLTQEDIRHFIAET
ncbi:ly6/PLAUR domain-containing protein 6-like [Ischnura elegans]|uniref:ly6/PLAUR domain-containing protein 6-like n=1 Tax=Ischnura elegans TaxID=197161 RepID=UPI001ED8AD5F|nr:ly6/PLAUR domain-containing protein 6-like [Ischnura elegans]